MLCPSVHYRMNHAITIPFESKRWEVSSVTDGVLSGGAGKGNRNPAIHAGDGCALGCFTIVIGTRDFSWAKA